MKDFTNGAVIHRNHRGAEAYLEQKTEQELFEAAIQFYADNRGVSAKGISDDLLEEAISEYVGNDTLETSEEHQEYCEGQDILEVRRS